MSKLGRRVVQVMVAAVGTVVMVALSSWPVAPSASNAGVLRLSWRALGREAEHCRPLSEAEIARQPAHMRRTEVCERRVEPYHLQVSIDGVEQLDTLVHAAGARGDRPIYVLRDFALRPGTHRVRVDFVEREAAPHTRPDLRRHFPDILRFAGPITVRARQIALVTYDDEARALVLRSQRR
ncbi:MAG TPA: hypothetical protein VK864_14820 [Longimicrobiales bacterium]|nr:hypothetical protein [Longimicrobiales bacterium]